MRRENELRHTELVEVWAFPHFQVLCFNEYFRAGARFPLQILAALALSIKRNIFGGCGFSAANAFSAFSDTNKKIDKTELIANANTKKKKTK